MMNSRRWRLNLSSGQPQYRTELSSMKLPLNDFIELLCEKLDKITSHSFIAKSQLHYLKHLKETIGPHEAIVLGDFAENFSFVVQDEI